MGIPSCGSALYAVQLVFELPEGFLKLLRCRFVKAAQNPLGGSRGTFELVHKAVGIVQLTLKFLHRGLVPGFGSGGNLFLQTACILFEGREHLLRLLAVDGENNIGCTCIICHISLVLNTMFVGVPCKYRYGFSDEKRRTGLVSGRIQGRREGAGKERTGLDFGGRQYADGSR